MGKQFDEVLTRLTKIESFLKTQQPPPMNFKEACGYLDVKAGTLYRWTSRSLIGHYKTGKKLVFTREDLDRYLLAHRVQTREELQEK